MGQATTPLKEEPSLDDEELEMEIQRRNCCIRYFIIMPEQSTMKQAFDAFIFIALALNFLLTPFTLAFDSVPQVTSV